VADTIWVRSGEEGGRVALFERNPAHPGGEVFVAGDDVAEVALTPAVVEALRRGRLVKVDGPTPAGDEAVPALEDVEGVGPATADKLREAGYETVSAVAAAVPNELAEAIGVTADKARQFVEGALALLGLAADGVTETEEGGA
jgi:predicted flap endonuclease-1-like 5' DNA nuclease